MRGADTSYRGTTFSERMRLAPCRESDPDISFPDGKGNKADLSYAIAKEYCARCPIQLRKECLEVAMRAEGTSAGAYRYGVYGGLDPAERAQLARDRQGDAPSACGDRAGTLTGRSRHLRAGEDICGPCNSAFVDSRRERREKKAAA